MKHTLSDGKEWGGFNSAAYWLDFEKVLGLALTQKRAADGKVEEIPTTVGEIYKSLADRRIEIEDHVLEIEITTDTGKLVFAGPSFIRKMLCKLLKLRNEGANPFSTQWFWYDWDWNRNVQERYSFFVVYDDRIVRESVSFFDYPGNGFDPSLFGAEDDSLSLGWSSEAACRKARTKFWYRKFYMETREGQLMVLRKPELSDRWGLDARARLLRKIYVLLWILIALVGFVLISVWR